MMKMEIIQYLPTLELLIFNLFSIDRCCHRKYSRAITGLILFLFSVAFFTFSLNFSKELSFQGDGKLSLFGFLYLIPFRFLYKEKLPLLFIICCTCWVYTLGILSLSIHAGSILEANNWFIVWIIENLLFLFTLFPFYKHLLPKYIFVTENIRAFDKYWYRYMTLSNCLTFLLLVVLNSLFLNGKPSVEKLVALFLLLSLTYVFYFILYRIVLDAIRLNHLEQEVSHDPLTGLRNRSQLWNDLAKLSDNGEEFSVLFMDLDQFKLINDQYGHITGDRYLKHFAHLTSEILQNKGKVYRFGGDEFVAVYPGLMPQEIINQLKECHGWEDGAPCPFNQVSVGMLFCEPPHQDVEQILQRVDNLMYQNKISKTIPS